MLQKISFLVLFSITTLLSQDIDINNPLVQKYLQENSISTDKKISNTKMQSNLSSKDSMHEDTALELDEKLLDKNVLEKELMLRDSISTKKEEDNKKFLLKSELDENIDDEELLLSIQKDELLLKKIKDNILEKQKEKDSFSHLKGKNPFLHQTENDILENIDNNKIEILENKELIKFGQSFFEQTSKEPLSYINPPDDYIVSVGDSLKISIYGINNNDYELEIDNEGNINIPKIGKLSLKGMNYFEVRESLKNKLENFYPKANVLVSLGTLRTISISVVGEAKKSGQYNLPALSKVKDALIYASGVSDVGSLRNIKIVRNKKNIANFDLYSLLRSGKASGDIVLRSGDIVFIPPAKNSVIVNGSVKTPAIYELQEKETLQDLIYFAGGVESDSIKNVKIERTINGEKKFIDVLLNSKAKIEDGDNIYIGKLPEVYQNRVTLLGNIYRSESYEISQDETASELLNKIIDSYGIENIFMPQTDMNYFVIQRVNSKTLEKETISKNLQKVINRDLKEDVVLKSGDELYFFNKNITEDIKYIMVEGAVIREGKFNFYNGMKLIDAIRAAGIKKESDTKKIRVISLDEDLQKVVKFYSLEESRKVLLKKYDEIKVSDLFETNEFQEVKISGAVNESGVFPYNSGLRLQDLVDYAKGIKQSARLDSFELVSYETKNNIRTPKIKRLNLKQALEENIALNPYDEVIIQEIKGWNDSSTITLSGEVLFPGEYTIMPGEKLSSVLKRAGGFTKDAFIQGTVFSREDVKKIQKEALEKQVKELENSILYYATKGSEAGSSSEDKTVLLKYMENIKAQTKDMEVVGRVAITLEKDLVKFASSDYDVILKDGDKLTIPTYEESVIVLGEVMSQTALAWKSGDDAMDYIEKVGGIKESGDMSGIFIVKANGEARKLGYSKIFGLSSKEIERGDVIVVPFDVSQFSGLKYAQDLTGILYQLAVSAAALQTVGAL